MKEEAYQDIVRYLATKASELVHSKKINDGIERIDYAAIFPTSEQEHAAILEKLSREGLPLKTTPTGTVYKLNKPIETSQGEIALVKLRIFDPAKTQRGYVDFQVEDYQNFKRIYLSTSVVEVTENSEGMEMLMVEDPDILLFFPETPIGKDFI